MEIDRKMRPQWYCRSSLETQKPDFEKIYTQECAECGHRPVLYIGRNRGFCKYHKTEAVQDLKGFWKKVAK